MFCKPRTNPLRELEELIRAILHTLGLRKPILVSVSYPVVARGNGAHLFASKRLAREIIAT